MELRHIIAVAVAMLIIVADLINEKNTNARKKRIIKVVLWAVWLMFSITVTWMLFAWEEWPGMAISLSVFLCLTPLSYLIYTTTLKTKGAVAQITGLTAIHYLTASLIFTAVLFINCGYYRWLPLIEGYKVLDEILPVALAMGGASLLINVPKNFRMSAGKYVFCTIVALVGIVGAILSYRSILQLQLMIGSLSRPTLIISVALAYVTVFFKDRTKTASCIYLAVAMSFVTFTFLYTVTTWITQIYNFVYSIVDFA